MEEGDLWARLEELEVREALEKEWEDSQSSQEEEEEENGDDDEEEEGDVGGAQQVKPSSSPNKSPSSTAGRGGDKKAGVYIVGWKGYRYPLPLPQ
jgi:hypothetical protein